MNISVPSKQGLANFGDDVADRYIAYLEAIASLDAEDPRNQPAGRHELFMDEMRPPQQVQDNLWALVYWSSLVIFYEYPIPVRLGLGFLATVLAGNIHTLFKVVLSGLH